MLTTIKGVYDNGEITLEEIPKIKKANVIVTILETYVEDIKTKRQLGTLKGKIQISEDFDAPIDLLKDYM